MGRRLGTGLRPDLAGGRRVRLALLAMTLAAAAAVWAGADPAPQGRPEPVVVDRIEAGQAVIELTDGRTVGLPASLVPAGSAEGDTLQLWLAPDPAATAERRGRIAALLGELGANREPR